MAPPPRHRSAREAEEEEAVSSPRDGAGPGALASRLSHASASCCRLEKVAQVHDSSDALGQLEPRDALAAMSRDSFPLDPRRFASVWDDRPPGGLGTD